MPKNKKNKRTPVKAKVSDPIGYCVIVTATGNTCYTQTTQSDCAGAWSINPPPPGIPKCN